MKQPYSDIEAWYEKPDPWGYKDHVDDLNRRAWISQILDMFCPTDFDPDDSEIHWHRWNRALDIGAGEGFITSILPAKDRHAFELSDQAASRLPKNVTRVVKPEGKYGLVLATGVLYRQYDHELFLQMIKDHASDTVLTCHMINEEIHAVADIGKQVFTAEFPYRHTTQKLRVFKI